MRKMWAILLVAALLLSVAKWLMWRLYFTAVLLYYAESGIELPSTEKIQEYSMKAAKKFLGIIS